MNNSYDKDLVAKIKVIKKLKNDSDVAALIGLSAADFSNRKRRGTLRSIILDWAIKTGENVSLLVGDITNESDRGDIPSEARKPISIPVLGRVPAGFPEASTEEVIEYISIPNAPEGAYALIVSGDSMAPSIRRGDYVIFVPGSEGVRSGDVVIANNEWGESMCKRYRERAGEKLLTSDNPEYQPVQPNGHYRIMGKVVRVWRNIDF